MNDQGVFYIEDKKCNFDVEIGREIEKDSLKNDTFVLWSGDSDFAEPIEKLLADNKQVILVCTAGRVASELNNLIEKGLIVFEINKIRNSICREKELQLSLADDPIPSIEMGSLSSQEEVIPA
ncbi:MAG: NYN domain-containing protein [Patescibacteria group bacterium]